MVCPSIVLSASCYQFSLNEGGLITVSYGMVTPSFIPVTSHSLFVTNTKNLSRSQTKKRYFFPQRILMPSSPPAISKNQTKGFILFTFQKQVTERRQKNQFPVAEVIFKKTIIFCYNPIKQPHSQTQGNKEREFTPETVRCTVINRIQGSPMLCH